METIATVEASPERLAQPVREAGVAPPGGDATYPLVPLRFGPDSLVAGTPQIGDGPAIDAEWAGDYFDAYDGPGTHRPAVLGTRATLDWLDWIGSGPVTAHVLAEDGVDDASAVRLEAGGHDVEIGPLPAAEGSEAVGERPSAPPESATTIETDGTTIERLADAAALAGDEGVPIVVEDGEFRLAVTGEAMYGQGTLSGYVTGPDCETRATADFAALARVLEGEVELAVVESGSLVVRQATDLAERTYRFDVRM